MATGAFGLPPVLEQREGGIRQRLQAESDAWLHSISARSGAGVGPEDGPLLALLQAADPADPPSLRQLKLVTLLGSPSGPFISRTGCSSKYASSLVDHQQGMVGR